MEKAEKMIKEMDFGETLMTACEDGVSHDQLECLDNEITYMLDCSRRHAKGSRRKAPFSKKK